jgi:sortase A
MRDRRSVDDLTVEELEQILRIKKRDARLQRLQRYEHQGRRRGDLPLPGDGLREEEAGEDDAPAQTEAIPIHSFVYGVGGEDWGKRSLRNRLLLAVEILAAVALIAILVFAALGVRDINRESAAAQAAALAELPTPSPTPLISVVVLPGGHTPPTSPGGAQPNYDEVPSYLRPLVEQQFAGPVIIPTPGPSHAVRLRIPVLGVDAPIVQGDGWEQLKRGVGQRIGTANPGTDGNLVLSAHDDIYGELFRHLDRLATGDEIIVETLSREYVYRVVSTRVVPPTEVSVMDPTQEPVVTLISCYPYLVNSDRIVVVGELVE